MLPNTEKYKKLYLHQIFHRIEWWYLISLQYTLFFHDRSMNLWPHTTCLDRYKKATAHWKSFFFDKPLEKYRGFFLELVEYKLLCLVHDCGCGPGSCLLQKSPRLWVQVLCPIESLFFFSPLEKSWLLPHICFSSFHFVSCWSWRIQMSHLWTMPHYCGHGLVFSCRKVSEYI